MLRFYQHGLGSDQERSFIVADESVVESQQTKNRVSGPNDRKAGISAFSESKAHSNFIGNSPFQMAVS